MSLYSQLQEKMNNVRIYGEYFMASCLWHGTDEHPSLMVRENGFRCLSCGKHGTLEYLDKYLGGHGVKIPSPKSVVLPQWRTWENKWGDLEGIAKHAHESCKRYPQWMFYFKERKIDEFFELGYFGYIEGWVTFPVFDEKRKIQNIVVRHTKRKDVRYAIKHVEDNKPLLYVPNWDRVKGSDVIYCPFGLIDVWSFEDLELPAITGITGKSIPIDTLKSLNKNIILVPDLWEEQTAHRIANSLGWKCTVKSINFPGDTKDPDEIRRYFGKETLYSLLMDK